MTRQMRLVVLEQFTKQERIAAMKYAALASILALASLIILGGQVNAQVGPPAPDAFWVDGALYATVGTPTNLPDRGPKDGIYVFSNLNGQHPVAEAKPGDRDYNGGRWQVTVLEFTQQGLDVHDPDHDGVANFELTSWEMVQQHIGLGHLQVAMPGPSFVCPVIRQH
jgi:hypothetical protein